jgi:hypothetical protein
LVCTAPSVNDTTGLPHAAVAVADPKAALISEAEGLQPSVGVAPVIMIVGGFGESVQFTVLVSVAVLPQASIAIKVLVCDLKHPLLLMPPSIEVTVGVPHPSVAVAVPSAAFMAAGEGLQSGGNGVSIIVITGAVRSSVHVTVLEMVAELLQASVAVNVLICVLKHPLELIGPSA